MFTVQNYTFSPMAFGNLQLPLFSNWNDFHYVCYLCNARFKKINNSKKYKFTISLSPKYTKLLSILQYFFTHGLTLYMCLYYNENVSWKIFMHINICTTIISHLDLITISFDFSPISSTLSLLDSISYCSHCDLSKIWI